jgi:hypothetical protein
MPRNTILNVSHARKCGYTCRSICWTEDQECSESLPQPPFQVAVALSTAQAAAVMPAPGEHHHSGQLDSIQKDPSFVNLGADGPSISAKPGQKVRADLHFFTSTLPFLVYVLPALKSACAGKCYGVASIAYGENGCLCLCITCMGMCVCGGWAGGLCVLACHEC